MFDFDFLDKDSLKHEYVHLLGHLHEYNHEYMFHLLYHNHFQKHKLFHVFLMALVKLMGLNGFQGYVILQLDNFHEHHKR